MAKRFKLRPTFQTCWSDKKEHVGKPFMIRSMLWMTEADHGGNPEPHFMIAFADGTEIQATTEEVFEGWAQFPASDAA